MNNVSVSSRLNSRGGLGARLGGSLFFLIFGGFGAVFTFLVVKTSLEGLRTWTWHRTNCEILASSVSETDAAGRRTGDFHFAVKYSYTFGGQKFISDLYKIQAGSISDYGDVARLVARYPTGASAACFVNPSAPGQAVLKRGNLFFPLMVLFPMVFVAIGVGGIYLMWRGTSAGVQNNRSISDGATARQKPAIAFFLFFLLLGGGISYGLFVGPMIRIFAARSWPAVSCVVVSSEVRSHSGSHGDTYSVNILYRYEVGGREYKANRYCFVGGSSGGYGGKWAVVNRYRPGTEAICYVNPADPTDSVLNRGFVAEMWFGLIPLAFVGFGGWGLIYNLRNRRRNMPARATAITGESTVLDFPSGAVPGLPRDGGSNMIELKRETPPWGKLLGSFAVALFWNGIVSIFANHVIGSWRSGRPQWFLTIFLIPFVLVGLALVGAIFKTLMEMCNPRPHVKVTPGTGRLGGQLRVEWKFTGRTDRLQQLNMHLEGREEATFREGKNTRTQKSIFANVEIIGTGASQEIGSGSRMVTIPAGAMHSFTGSNNKIVWSIHLRGKIWRWPDVKEAFPISVMPGGPTPAS